MAGAVAYRKSAWNNATNAQRAFLRAILNALNLGEPAIYDDGGVQWFVFHDSRINQTFVENLAWANSMLTAVTSEPDRTYPTTEIVQIEVPVRIQVDVAVTDENGDPTGEIIQVWQDHPTDTRMIDEELPLGDVLSLAADAQGVVNWFAAATSVPASWSPVGV